MSVFRYRAFISYSHQDESVAAWLHRALESYRIPRRLVGNPGLFGAVPARLAPVFRDRDDLSSANDLSEKIQHALEESETLVVVCSPAAAQSRWVNQEIRQFRALGRGDRIYCVIVDGDPRSSDPQVACFPPALLENREGLRHEPAAADIRTWADGKSLAKLKLVAGILGTRLDELRQRDLHRKRRLRLLAGLVAVAVAALAVFAFQARQAEQDERVARMKDRENAEIMLSQFIEATENLDQMADLQTRRTFSEVASSFLKNLDPNDLGIESRRNLGRILQDQGEINFDEGEFQLAMDLFVESREILNSIFQQNRGDGEAIFDLSQVEYYIGRLHYSQGRFEDADRAFSAYHDASEKLIRLDPGNVDWVMEMAYALNNLGYIEMHRNPPAPARALGFYQAALQYTGQAVLLDETRKTELADFYADLADAWLGICNLEEALSTRIKGAQFAEQHYREDPANNKLKRAHAFAQAGLAKVQRLTGAVEPALASLRQSVDMLNELYQEDRTRQQYRWNLLNKSDRAAHLMSISGQADEAWDWYVQIESMALELIEDDKDISLSRSLDYPYFLINYAGAAFRRGENSKANRLLDEGIRWLEQIQVNHPHESETVQLLAYAAFYRWAYNNGETSGAGTQPDTAPVMDLDNPQSCEQLDLRARQAVMSGDAARAREFSNLLHAKGYQEPGFMRFCSEYDVCGKY